MKSDPNPDVPKLRLSIRKKKSIQRAMRDEVDSFDQAPRIGKRSLNLYGHVLATIRKGER